MLDLALYIFWKVGSKTVVNRVSNFGFCSGYSDVTLFESSGASSWKPDVEEDAFCHYVFDNEYFNIKSLIGKGAFHSIGGIKCITPSTSVRTQEITILQTIPSSTKIAVAGQIPIETFRGKLKADINAVKLQTVYNSDDCKYDSILKSKDILWMYGKFLQTPFFPTWPVFMESTTHRPYPTLDQTKISSHYLLSIFHQLSTSQC